MLQKNPGLARTTSPGIQEPAADGSTKAPKKRTKSGCLTCRKRRIKCGEEKPNCKNCSKTKRVCEQPTVPTTLPRSRPNRPGQFIGDVRLSLQQQSLQPGLPDADDDDFLARYNSRQSQPRSYSNPRSTGSGNSPTLGQFSVHDLHHTSAAREDSSRGQFEPPEHTLDHRYLAADFTGDLHQSQTATNFAPGLSSASSPGPSVRYGQDFIDHDSIYAQSQLAQDVFPLDRVQDSASPLYKHDSSVPEPLPSFTHTSQEQGTVRNAEGFGSAGLQDYEFSGGVEGRLTPLQAHYIQHFIRNVNLNFTAIVEVPTGPSDPPRIQPSNFWSFVIPSMAMKSEPLFHAVMAISALHEANMLNKPEHTALMDYHVAIKKLGGALLESGAFERDDLLATCLILAYFETMHGEMVKWGRHLQGACDIVRRRITNQYTINQDGRYKFTINPTTSDHLIWFHIHQDTIQAILSGNGLFLGLEYIEMCPVRGEPGSVTHRSDQLRVFLARIGDFACKDRRRKEEAAEDDNALISATVRWDTLMSTLTGWRTQLTEDFTSSPVRHATTPFGAVLVFAHPAIASCQIMSLAALIYLHRSHPLYSRVPAEAVKASAASTYLIGQDIIRILSGIMVEGVNNKGIDNGSHVKAMINAVLPVLLAGVAIGGEERRDYVDRLVQDVYTFTGWRTAVRVLQAFDVAWQRPPRDFGMPSLEEDPALEHESEPGSTAASYVPMDKFEVLNTAAGVLGRIKLVSDRYLQPRSSDPSGLAWTGETGQFGASYLQDGGALADAPRLEYASLSGATVPDYRAGYVDPIAQHSQGPWPPAGHGQRPYELDLDGGLGGWTGTGNRM